MKRGLVIADSGAIFSLAIIGKLNLLELLFDSIRIPYAVWEEVSLEKDNEIFKDIDLFFRERITKISSFNDLTFIMDYGESESVILYKELKADFLLIDDKKARKIAENFGLNCIGTLGLLILAKKENFVKELKPTFKALLKNKRYFSLNLLNKILKMQGETEIDEKDVR